MVLYRRIYARGEKRLFSLEHACEVCYNSSFGKDTSDSRLLEHDAPLLKLASGPIVRGIHYVYPMICSNTQRLSRRLTE